MIQSLNYSIRCESEQEYLRISDAYAFLTNVDIIEDDEELTVEIYNLTLAKLKKLQDNLKKIQNNKKI